MNNFCWQKEEGDSENEENSDEKEKEDTEDLEDTEIPPRLQVGLLYPCQRS